MTQIVTDLRVTVESAKRTSFAPNGTIGATNVQDAIDEVAVAVVPIVPTEITFASSPYTVLAGDTLIWVNTSGGAVEIDLPTGVSRIGVPLQIKDISGNALANNITLDPQAAETIDGLDPMLIEINYGGVTLYPKPSGGWATQP